jgi:surface antigen
VVVALRFREFDMWGSRISALALAGVTLTACAGDPNMGPRQQSGAGLGALTGAIVGASVAGGGAGSRIAGAVIGAAAGGILGGAIGASLDQQEREQAYAAEMQALEYGQPGAPTGWRGRRAGYYGSVVPGPYYMAEGRRCREYTHTIYVGGRPESARGVACRNPDGSWTPVG